jgi:hypothetical protein
LAKGEAGLLDHGSSAAMLTVAYGWLADQVDAWRADQCCVERLQSELDVEPARATAALFETLVGR